MADIFISYSKPDRDKVVMLAAYLESEGWTVWWDTNLAVADAYRDEIMRQLAAARAVIVLWTQTSTKSDFVRAEAGRAKADGKLIPVKEPDVAYADIPLPFGEMHTEESTKRELIRAAVVAQLAKPQVQPNALWVATKTARYQVLTWVGILGGAVTLFANMQGVLNLSEWARWFTTHWHDLAVGFWQTLGSLIGIKPPGGIALMLSFLCFCLLTALGARRLASAASLPPPDKALPRRILLWYIGLFVGAITLCMLSELLFPTREGIARVFTIEGLSRTSAIAFVSWPLVIVGNEEDRLKGKRLSFLAISYAMILFYFLLFFREGVPSFVGTFSSLTAANTTELSAHLPTRLAQVLGFDVLIFSVMLVPHFVTAAMLMIAPTRAIATRLAFLATALVFLVALNQLSHYAPDIRLLLKPPA